jgi:hypothetical protein
MKIEGYLSEFSLGELFRFLKQGQKTGCLSIVPVDAPENAAIENKVARNFNEKAGHFIFFQRGDIAAASNSIDGDSLIKLMEKRSLLGAAAIQKMMPLWPGVTPLGLWLKANGVIDVEDLRLLFKQQVLTPIPHLFALREGWFTFDARQPLPYQEMTGWSASPMEIALAGLRMLREWEPLLDKLPLPSSTIISTTVEKPAYRLNSAEWQVWEHVNGNLSLEEIAKSLNQSILEVQKVCFRFMVIGIAEEIASIATSAAPSSPSVTSELLPVNAIHVKAENGAATDKGTVGRTETGKVETIETFEVSQPFLQGLLTFLKTRKNA